MDSVLKLLKESLNEEWGSNTYVLAGAFGLDDSEIENNAEICDLVDMFERVASKNLI